MPLQILMDMTRRCISEKRFPVKSGTARKMSPCVTMDTHGCQTLYGVCIKTFSDYGKHTSMVTHKNPFSETIRYGYFRKIDRLTQFSVLGAPYETGCAFCTFPFSRRKRETPQSDLITVFYLFPHYQRNQLLPSGIQPVIFQFSEPYDRSLRKTEHLRDSFQNPLQDASWQTLIVPWPS